MASYEVKRSITIDSSPEPIYNKIVNFREWPTWSPWEDMDPNMTKRYSGPDSGVGAAYSWQGNRKVGEGSMAITDVNAPKKINLDLEFLKPFKASNKTVFDLESTGSGTEVTWTMTGEHNLLSRIMSVFVSMDKMVGKDFEKGLANLKRTVEA